MWRPQPDLAARPAGSQRPSSEHSGWREQARRGPAIFAPSLHHPRPNALPGAWGVPRPHGPGGGSQGHPDPVPRGTCSWRWFCGLPSRAPLPFWLLEPPSCPLFAPMHPSPAPCPGPALATTRPVQGEKNSLKSGDSEIHTLGEHSNGRLKGSPLSNFLPSASSPRNPEI